MTIVTTSTSKLGTTHRLHKKNDTAAPTVAPRAPVRILQCDICLNDFEWFSLKDIIGCGEDPQDETLSTQRAALPRNCKLPSTHTHGRGYSTGSGASSLPPAEGLKLGCSLHNGKDHAFCMDCLARYIDTQVRANAWPVVCPNEKCNESISPNAVEIVLGKEALQRWYHLGVEHAIHKKIYCPYVECGLLIDGDRNDDSKPIYNSCPYCCKAFCAMCYGKVHTGNNCERRQEKMFEVLATDRKWKACPSCRLMIEKVSGCNHMTCRCGTHFCYICGSKGIRCNNRH